MAHFIGRILAILVVLAAVAPAIAEDVGNWRSTPPNLRSIAFDYAGNRLYWDDNGMVAGRFNYATKEFEPGAFKAARWYDLSVERGSAITSGYSLAKLQRDAAPAVHVAPAKQVAVTSAWAAYAMRNEMHR